MKKKIVFVSGTRADYGKIKNLILKSQKLKQFQTHVFVTGMHNMKKYGSTYLRLYNDKVKNISRFNNQKTNDRISNVVAKTVIGFSSFLVRIRPDIVVIHGDRIEALACAQAAVFNNIKVAHIEGGEITGSLDEIMRHAITKLSHVHFVSNNKAKNRLIQMGEKRDSIFNIGSTHLSLIKSKNLPEILDVKKRYNINFEKYGIIILHPITHDHFSFFKDVKKIIDEIKELKINFVIINPNNDFGSSYIFEQYKNLKKLKNFKIIKSMRFEYYLTLLKNCRFILGNSSSGIIEAPYFGVPSINLGNRQKNRSFTDCIKNVDFNKDKILYYIKLYYKYEKRFTKKNIYGNNNSEDKFIKVLKQKKIWSFKFNKQFIDVKK